MFRKILATLAFGILFSGIPHVSVAGRKADTQIANRVAHHANPNYKTAVSDLIQTVLERI